jgi:hypothetical protein
MGIANTNINAPTDNPTTPHFVKTNIRNLINLEPMLIWQWMLNECWRGDNAG